MPLCTDLVDTDPIPTPAKFMARWIPVALPWACHFMTPSASRCDSVLYYPMQMLWRGPSLKTSNPKQNICQDGKISQRFWKPQRRKSYFSSWSNQSQNPSPCIPFCSSPSRLLQPDSVLPSFNSYLSFLTSPHPTFLEPKQLSLTLAEKCGDCAWNLNVYVLGVSQPPLQAQGGKAFLKCLPSAYDFASTSSIVSFKVLST